MGLMSEGQQPVFLNTSVPFCAVTVGVQGSGKSHSVASIIENCTLQCSPVTNTTSPCATIIFHYDTDEANYCQAATLTRPDSPSLPAVTDLVVLVSPSYFYQRRKFYQHWPNCRVAPLLFRWREMTAGIIKSLMRVDSSREPPLYMSALLDLLRKLQKRESFPTFASFKEQITSLNLTSQQTGPLNLRLKLIESLMADSDENRELLEGQVALVDVCRSGTVVICDLTDPMMTAAEARAVFDVLVERFRIIPMSCGKVVVFDEAHKYMSDSADDLAQTIVELVRQMRHHGMRIIISSQSPMTLPDEIFELVSICLMHKFHSRDWFTKLKLKLPLQDAAFDRILAQTTGEAVVFCSQWDSAKLNARNSLGHGVHSVAIRPRITCDGGQSKLAAPHQLQPEEVTQEDNAPPATTEEPLEEGQVRL
eukprot:TRINITY_DN1470_c0_g1_i1.p1 TRINITY_DN1470_c0_g1~~TRINITY_DN1470_c0_g1_i1.p1  ORF type:complete len:444 (-),score=34.47 TRINITY_DN1470_c0_g1_i1:423-1688(-)